MTTAPPDLPQGAQHQGPHPTELDGVTRVPVVAGVPAGIRVRAVWRVVSLRGAAGRADLPLVLMRRLRMGAGRRHDVAVRVAASVTAVWIVCAGLKSHRPTIARSIARFGGRASGAGPYSSWDNRREQRPPCFSLT